MKWKGFIILTVLLQVFIYGHSQTVNLSGKNLSLTKIFTSIKKQTGTLFFYDDELIKEAKPVTVKLRNVPLQSALNEIFKDQPFTWVLEDKTVTITKKPESLPTPPQPALNPSRQPK